MLNLGGFCSGFFYFLSFALERGIWLCISHATVVCSHCVAPTPLWFQHILEGIDHPALNKKES